MILKVSLWSYLEEVPCKCMFMIMIMWPSLDEMLEALKLFVEIMDKKVHKGIFYRENAVCDWGVSHFLNKDLVAQLDLYSGNVVTCMVNCYCQCMCFHLRLFQLSTHSSEAHLIALRHFY